MRPLLFLALLLSACATTPKSAAPAEPSQDITQLYGPLFERVQMSRIFEDSKYFVDMTPKDSPGEILASYRLTNPKTDAELRSFVEKHFLPPAGPMNDFKIAEREPIDQHIRRLWKALRREPKDEKPSTLIPLPYPYIVPGGRFREIYYWDSYFTQLGLLADGETELFQDMVKNFAHQLETLGRIPNGNRSYYLGRSQPPFFSHMVALWRDKFGAPSAARFLPALIKEHDFWMAGERAVRLGENEILNRYWDDRAEPRPESYREDVLLAQSASRPPVEVYRDLRAAAESGMDFSTRWFADRKKFATIQTTSLIPIDLNSLLYHLETEIARLARAAGDVAAADRYAQIADKRLTLMRKYFWDEKSGTFRDYNWRTKKLSNEVTIAMTVPLFVGIATQAQADRCIAVLEKDFLKPGGFVTSLHASGQQWDAPNGWPPHQWMAYVALKRYGKTGLAEKARTRWLELNRKVYQATGKLMEKYNVVNLSLISGGGEYPAQDGFGWTNGVYRALSDAR